MVAQKTSKTFIEWNRLSLAELASLPLPLSSYIQTEREGPQNLSLLDLHTYTQRNREAKIAIIKQGRPYNIQSQTKMAKLIMNLPTLVQVAAVSILLHTTYAKDHTVGGATGWIIPPTASFYSTWASSATFQVNDTLGVPSLLIICFFSNFSVIWYNSSRFWLWSVK